MERLAHSLSAEAFFYPTEDWEKVNAALKLVVPFEFEEQKIESFHGATIVRLVFETKSPAEIKKVLGNFKQFREQVPERIDEDGNLYLRVDKQRAALGELALDGKDTIRIKVKVASYPFRLQNVIKNAEALFA